MISIVVTGVIPVQTAEGRVFLLSLREKDGRRRCLMKFDLDCIRYIMAAQQQATQDHLPLFHGAALDLLAIAGMRLHHIEIPGYSGSHFQTILHFRHNGNRPVYRELMPSDAVAMALHADCPILIDDELLTASDRQAAAVLERIRQHATPSTLPIDDQTMLTLPKDELPQA